MRNFQTSFDRNYTVRISAVSGSGSSVKDGPSDMLLGMIANLLERAMSNDKTRQPLEYIQKEAELMIRTGYEFPRVDIMGLIARDFCTSTCHTSSEVECFHALGRFIRAVQENCFSAPEGWSYVNLNEGFTVLVLNSLD